MAALSFNGNKIITTSGGGMLISDDEELIKKARFFWPHRPESPKRYYEHKEIIPILDVQHCSWNRTWADDPLGQPCADKAECIVAPMKKRLRIFLK
ncbi:MAG: DegT/DnrJ/EryC1/StrS family aminotransferase [Merdibacter sp.]